LIGVFRGNPLKTSKFNILVLFLFVMALIASPSFAHAKMKADKLDADNVKEFIEKTTAISNGEYGDLDTRQVEKYLQNHLHDQARFISEMTYVIPGFPPQQSVLSLKKEEFMSHVEQSATSVEDYKNEIEIIDIALSKDKRTATVRTRGTERGAMQVQEGALPVSIEGTSKCTQILLLSEDDVIQMFNARCKTRINFTEF